MCSFSGFRLLEQAIDITVATAQPGIVRREVLECLHELGGAVAEGAKGPWATCSLIQGYRFDNILSFTFVLYEVVNTSWLPIIPHLCFCVMKTVRWILCDSGLSLFFPFRKQFGSNNHINSREITLPPFIPKLF